MIPGPFEENTQWKILQLGAYVGEVIIRNTNGTKWNYLSDDNSSIINIELKSNNLQMWPIARTFRRVKNGMEDELHPYVEFAVARINGII